MHACLFVSCVYFFACPLSSWHLSLLFASDFGFLLLSLLVGFSACLFACTFVFQSVCLVFSLLKISLDVCLLLSLLVGLLLSLPVFFLACIVSSSFAC
jgi:hypothetical protein